jgi:hexulose-6-phosphate isomerase
MQGRLLPPINGQIQAFPSERWEDEFERAAGANLRSIEWIFDGSANPIFSDPSIDRLRARTQATGVDVRSVCADFFMDSPLLRAKPSELVERLAILRRLLVQSRAIGAEHIVLPFVDQSAIRGRHERVELAGALSSIAEEANASGVELHLETSLGPQEFAELLDSLPSGVFRANYDSGNSASLGYDVREEFNAYGARIGSVHVKDRRRGSVSVPLGTGDVNFPVLFECLARVKYDRRYILQVARGAEGDEISWARENREFVRRLAMHDNLAST